MTAPLLDPSTVRLTHHVVTRYMERRGWPMDPAYMADAELAIRDLLGRVAHKNPPLYFAPGREAVRRYVAGGLCWIVSADNSTVITFYKHASLTKYKGRKAA